MDEELVLTPSTAPWDIRLPRGRRGLDPLDGGVPLPPLPSLPDPLAVGGPVGFAPGPIDAPPTSPIPAPPVPYAGPSPLAPIAPYRPAPLAPTSPNSNIAPELQKMIEDALKSVLSGGQTRFSPGVVEAMKGQLLSATQGRAAASATGIKEEAATRGMLRSGATTRALQQSQSGADATYSQGVAGIGIQKAQADFDDRVAGLDRAQKNIDSTRQEVLQREMNALQREQLMAQIAMGYANINAERENLNNSMRQQWEMFQIGRTPRPGLDTFPIMGPDGNPVQVPSWLLPYLGGGGL